MFELKVGDKVKVIKKMGTFAVENDVLEVTEIKENKIEFKNLTQKLSYCWCNIKFVNNYVEKIEEQNMQIKVGKNLLDLSNKLVYRTDNPYLVKYQENLKDCTDKVKKDGGKNMQEKAKELIITWLTKVNEKLNAKLEEQKEKLINEDIVVQEYDNVVDTIKSLLEEFQTTYPETNPNFEFQTKNRNSFITDDTKAEIKEVENSIEEQKEENRRIANEAIIAIGICTTEESLRKVLKNYNIIDKDGKIKIK